MWVRLLSQHIGVCSNVVTYITDSHFVGRGDAPGVQMLPEDTTFGV